MILANPNFLPDRSVSTSAGKTANARRFHRTWPNYFPTPLVELPELAAEMGFGRLLVKNESLRLGLPSYKILGGSWAIHEAVRRALGEPADRMLPWEEFRSRASKLPAQTLCTATDGNHGRGIAAVSQQLQWPCHIFVPDDMVAERRQAIERHGAFVIQVQGGYDAAVAQSHRFAKQEGAWLCADTMIGGESSVARQFAADVQRGYHTLLEECWEQLGAAPDYIVVPSGVGALAASVIQWIHQQGWCTKVVTVEPVGSACVLASLANGRPTKVSDPYTSMAGLRSQHASLAAWPDLHQGVWLAVAIDDHQATLAMRALASYGIVAGESGAAGLAGCLQLLESQEAKRLWMPRENETVVIINTEGATDKISYENSVNSGAAMDSRGSNKTNENKAC